ncbi:MAG: HpaII family restriction endonuclease [Pseudanabaena sp.]|nr:MAG: HpaII family restriction endonuclease [Pseudanabaena sp.]
MVSKFTFIDLFAGIGGFHLAMHRLGGKCVFASEIDLDARKTYQYNFEVISPELFLNGLFNSDIRTVVPSDIPDFDLLCAGFPCQPFSQAGYKRGFDDNHKSERGNLFFNIVDIIEAKKPKAIFLENVRGLVSHDSGKTFSIIRNILENELGYSFYFKVVQASDYGLPQLRPRVFIVGFRDEGLMRGFNFPAPKPLKFTMSEVWGGKCSRDIGFTIRVGGRGSQISDRRNWDAYLVDGKICRLSHVEAKKMQGFPDDFHLPVSDTQAIKQLGNSVAVDVVEEIGHNLIDHMNLLSENISKASLHNTQGINMKTNYNKGEWSELLLFIKLLAEQQLYLADFDLKPKEDFFNIHKVTTQNMDLEFLILGESQIEIVNKITGYTQAINISEIITSKVIQKIVEAIKNKSGTFDLNEFLIIQDALGFNVVKGGYSLQKSDILLDISNQFINKKNEGFGIKSYLGAKPTLLNASGNTNFVFQIENLHVSDMDKINAIDTATKLRDRIRAIEESGGRFKYIGAEKDTMTHNLKMVDSFMPEIVAYVLLSFYRNRISHISKIVDFIDEQQLLNEQINYGDKSVLKYKIKKLLVDVLLGFFAGSKWDGSYEANGNIVIKSNGDCLAFHIIDIETLKKYLYENIKLDTPSTTRHRYGKLYMEKDNKLYFKLNLQMRF